MFGTIVECEQGDVRVSEGPHSRELVASALEIALNYLFIRGVKPDDARWLAALCEFWSEVDATTVVRELLRADSEFMGNWGSDVPKSTLKIITDAL
mmetsp:Transcript_5676/g.21500  ORF Transcript_5676/g.21500 Transcript_5676/m.21500 type:complete len:96 (+) Transcript_5676:485-772(+)